MITRAAIANRHPALRSRDFRRIFFNAFFASASHWTMLLARGWLVFELTGQARWVGAVTFAGMIPLLLAGPIGGALADRADRRRMAIAADGVSIISALGLAAITIPGFVEPWHVLAFAALGGTARAFGTPAEQALIPNVVPKEHLLNAVALAGITRHGSRVLGPSIGGAMLATLGPGSVFVLSGCFVALALYQISRLEFRSPPAAGEMDGPLFDTRRIIKDIGEGFSYLERDARVAFVMVLVGLHCGLTMAFDSMMPTLATSVGGADRTYSAIIVGVGVGAIAGTLTISMLRTERAQGRALLIAGIGSGAAMLVIGFAATPYMAVFGGDAVRRDAGQLHGALGHLRAAHRARRGARARDVDLPDARGRAHGVRELRLRLALGWPRRARAADRAGDDLDPDLPHGCGDAAGGAIAGAQRCVPAAAGDSCGRGVVGRSAYASPAPSEAASTSCAIGSVKQTVAPGERSATQMRPPRRWTSWRVIARPRPAPPPVPRAWSPV